MMKRLTAWLLVLCMTLSLLPGTAFAASGGGEVTITYDLNDGKSSYQLQLKTTTGNEPNNKPGAKWAGRPFAGWSSDPNQNIKPDYSKDTTLYAMWKSGYSVTINYGQPGISTAPPTTLYKTESSGKLSADDVAEINKTVDDFERLGTYAFAGWYLDQDFKKEFGAITGTIENDNTTLYAKWVPIYTITFEYNNSPDGPAATPPNPEIPDQIIRTTTGGVLIAVPPAPTYTDDPYTFDGWYILDEQRANPTKPLRNALPIIDGNLKGKNGIKITQDELAKYSFTDAAEDLGKKGITVQANWTVPYGIIFDANGGHFGTDENKVKDIIKTDKFGNISPENWPENPTREGEKYKFEGWYKYKPSTPGGDPTDDELIRGEKFSEPTHVYAKWKKQIEVTIDYDATGYKSETRYIDPDAEKTEDKKIPDLDALLDKITSVEKKGYVFQELWHVKGRVTQGDGTTSSINKDLTPEETKQLAFEGDTTIKAVWKQGYYIEFDYNGATKVGTATDPTAWEKGVLADTRGYIEFDKLPVPERDRYTFDAWYTEDGKKVVEVKFGDESKDRFYDVGQKSQTIQARWKAPYTITLNPDGGTITQSNGTTTTTPITIKCDENGKYLAFPVIVRDGKKFLGWYEMDPNGFPMKDKEAKPGGTCPGPIELIPDWGDFTITLNPNGGMIDGSTGTITRTTVNGKIPFPTPTYTPPGTTTPLKFDGWINPDGNRVDDKPDYIFSDDITLTARWGGTTTTSITPSNTPAKPFSTSRPSAATADGPMVIAGEYTITFKYDDGTTADETKTTTDGKVTPLPQAPTRTGYTFLGWFNGSTEVTADTVFTKDTTVTAKWHEGYKITFDLKDNGEGTPPEPIWTDTKGNVPITAWKVPAERDGYEFTGWYTGQSCTDSSCTDSVVGASAFTGPTTVHAHWNKIGYLITFDENYLAGSKSSQRASDKDDTLPIDDRPVPTRDKYSFAGWYFTPDCAIAVPDTYKFTKSTTVYAKWTEEYTLTFHHHNGTNETTVVTTKDKKLPDGKLPDYPAYGGHTCDGWFTEEIGGTKFTTSTEITGDMDLHAHWTAGEFTITFDLNDGDATNPSTTITRTTVGGKVDLTPPNRSGWRFEYWEVITPDPSAGSGIPAVDEKILSGDDVIFTYNAKLKAKWEDLNNPTTPPGPGEKDTVIHFIVDVPEPLDDAAHFVMAVDDRDYLQQLPELIFPGVDSDGWRLENGERANLGPYGKDTNLYVNTTEAFTITFDWNNAKDGGTSKTATRTTNKDGRIDPDQWPVPENPGYYFDNWYTEATGGIVVPQTKIFDGPTTVYAHWKGPFTVTFDANGGKFPDGTTEIKIETDDNGNLDSAKIPEDPTREGYGSFKGWSLTEDGTEAVEPDAKPYDGAATLYAIWGPPYDITYDAMGGEVTPTEEQLKSTEEGKYPELPVPTHTRDSFGGWYTTQDYQEGTQATAGGDCPGAVTLYAKWTREPPYTITFEANREGATMEDPDSGAAVTTITLKTDDKGVLMKAPPEPMLRGGKFQGWYTKAEEGTGDLVADAATRTYTDDTTLYAHWETMEFKITFDFNLSAIMSNPTNVTTYTTTKGGSLTYLPGDLPQASSGDKKISGWYRVPNPTAKDQPVTKSDVFYRDTTLYAQWVDAEDPPIVFKYPNITFMNEDGNKAMITLEVDTDYKLATFPEPPYKEGHTFTGWVTRDPDGTEHPLTSDTLITGSLVAYPKYAQKGYTITFEPGEETELDPTKVTTTSEGRIPDGSMPDDPVWEGHTFNGWYTSATGGTKINRRTVFTQDTTVYAHWDGSNGETPSGEYTITFDADGGSVTPTSATTVNGKLQILPTPTKSGYTFDGWYNGTSAVTVDTVYTADTTLTAHWKSDGGSDGPSSAPYTITFNPNGGNLETAATALTDLQGRLMSIPTPRRTGYKFDGWYNGTERVTTATVFTKNTEVVARWTTGSGGGSGSDSGTNGDNGYTVTVNNNSGGRVSVSTTYAREGDRVTVTIRPYTGYQLDQINVTNARGYDVSLRDQGGNRYTFYMPASRVTVDATFMELIANGNGNGDNGGNNGGNTGGNTGGSTGGNGGTGGTLNPITPPVTSGNGVFSEPVLNTVPMPYVDVTPSAWYYSSVDYMWQRSLMGGVSANRFGPQATTSNAMIWTILARLAGVDVTAGGGIWYENARSWAVSNRISDGVGPNNAVTREQLATMLWNYRGSPAASYDLGRFGDRGQISTYQAENALRWAVANNIVSGSGNRLNPRGTATRAEVAAMITRFCQNT